ncbi:Crp/Fnr family transcriptional regulator [Desulfamplus magnetovallimortis]|nr:cyclic nucleotide-binding domain-containing protein [Desulfamplus magnetovallimortis]
MPITEVLEVNSGEIIFAESDPAEDFYMVKSGKVLLEQKLSEDIMVTVSSIDPGESFGLSVLLNRDVRSMAAICNESATIFVINRNSLLALMEEDHSLGYRIMKQTARVLNKRWVLRTEQFLRSLRTHPDIHGLESYDQKVPKE